ncbi:MAG TPA: hypothetical protein VF885_05880 [Arthrobacter sp.]
MLTNGRSRATHGLAFNGCACHNSPNARRRAKKGAKAKDKTAALRHERAAGSY